MKYVKIIFAVAFVFTLCTAFTMKNGGNKPVYAFGIAASFNDSVVYYTEVQLLDSVSLDKNGFLPKRDLYSYQLKNYIEYDLQKPDYTCMIYFAESKKKLEKEAAKVKGKYKKDVMVLKAIEPVKFTFKKPEE
ncbi:MAG: hypothetical protein LUE99_19160 [Bacteroides sp.]|nr:hypothetical protein [Bacteroides sp.]